MKKILIKVKKVYLKRYSRYKTKNGFIFTGCTAVGFCSVVNNSFYFESEERKGFQKFLKEFTKNQKVFYNCEGSETKERDQFVWKPRDIQVRLDWLDEQISKLKD